MPTKKSRQTGGIKSGQRSTQVNGNPGTNLTYNNTEEAKMTGIMNNSLVLKLGNSVPFDGRGDVIIFDDFENDINKWQILTSGTNSTCNSSAVRARNGGFSANLHLGINGSVTMRRWLPYKTLGRFGFEYSFTIEDGVQDLLNDIYLYTGSKLYVVQFRYRPIAKDVQIRYPDGGWQTIETGFILKKGNYCFHTIKGVFDFQTGHYIRLIIDGKEWNLASYSLNGEANTELPYMMVELKAVGMGSTSYDVYIDDAIITQNEP